MRRRRLNMGGCQKPWGEVTYCCARRPARRLKGGTLPTRTRLMKQGRRGTMHRRRRQAALVDPSSQMHPGVLHMSVRAMRAGAAWVPHSLLAAMAAPFLASAQHSDCKQ